MDDDWTSLSLIFPAMLSYGLRCWARAWLGGIIAAATKVVRRP